MLTKAHTVETPLGELEVDLDAVNKLNETVLMLSFLDDRDSLAVAVCVTRRTSIVSRLNCHSFITSLEPMLRWFSLWWEMFRPPKRRKWRSIFVVFCNSRALAPYLLDPKTAFVISSDFCHWGENFDYMYCKDRSLPFWKNIEELDKQGAALIEKEDADAFAEYIEDTGNTICGHNCIEIYLRALKESGLNMIFFMLTNIIRESTELLCCGQNADTLVKSAFRLPDDSDTYELKGLVSRKKQLIPALAGMIQQMEEMR